MAVGRPSIYTEEMAQEICTRIAGGESLRSICRDKHMPHHHTVLLWVVNDKEGFFDHYAKAREAQAHFHVDEMLDMRKELISGELDPNAARVAADIIKWTSGRMGRKYFGDKPAESGGQPAAVNINIVDAKKPD